MSGRLHHVNGPECLLCEEKLLGGSALIRTWGRKIRIAFPDAHFAWVWRGEADQNKAVKDGASELRWPLSKHNAMEDGKPASKAFDVFQLSERGSALWPWPYYSEIAEWLTLSDAPLDWGYSLWKKDGPHFQEKA